MPRFTTLTLSAVAVAAIIGGTLATPGPVARTAPLTTATLVRTDSVTVLRHIPMDECEAAARCIVDPDGAWSLIRHDADGMDYVDDYNLTLTDCVSDSRMMDNRVSYSCEPQL